MPEALHCMNRIWSLRSLLRNTPALKNLPLWLLNPLSA
jgi:hypothetical protein